MSITFEIALLILILAGVMAFCAVSQHRKSFKKGWEAAKKHYDKDV